jgi:Leucine-rich repeat (LRR) protein
MCVDEFELREYSPEEQEEFYGEDLIGIPFDTLPQELFLRKNLKSLWCRETDLKSISAEIAQLEWLENMDLQDNYLSKIDPAINQLKHLQRLDLTRNRLEEVDFSGLVNLKYLYLSDNRLKVFPPSLLALPQLKILFLDSNQIEYLPAISKSLGILFIAGNQISHMEPIDSDTLSTLYLSRNRLKTLPPINAPRLRHLAIHSNEFTELPSALLSLKQLEILELDFSLFDRQQLHFWPRLKELTLEKWFQSSSKNTAERALEIEQIKADEAQLQKELQLTHPELKLTIRVY